MAGGQAVINIPTRFSIRLILCPSPKSSSASPVIITYLFAFLTYEQNLRHPDEKYRRVEKQRELALCHRNALVHGA